AVDDMLVDPTGRWRSASMLAGPRALCGTVLRSDDDTGGPLLGDREHGASPPHRYRAGTQTAMSHVPGGPPLRIALLGTRGVPASYSGFETCAEELGARLAARGHAVTVYCRVPHIAYPGREYRGMRLVKLPTIRSKHLDTIAHSALASL